MWGGDGAPEPVLGTASSRASLGSVIPAFLGLEAGGSGLEAGGTGPEGWGPGELMGNERFQDCLTPPVLHPGPPAALLGLFQQRVWDPSVSLVLASFLCLAGLQAA